MLKMSMRKSAIAYVFLSIHFPIVSAVLRTRLTWVNGIGYNLDHMGEGQKGISKLFGGKKVLFCHNPTSMVNDEDMAGYLGDLTQAGTQKLGRITEEVNALVQHLKSAVDYVGRKGRVIHIAHSQGALVTALAAKQLTPLEMNQIEILAFGGAAALRRTPQTPFHRCINYYSVNDPLLWVVPSAEQALRSGFVADEEFCFLAPRVGDPIADHHLLNPTYAQALSWEGQRFQRQYQSLAYRSFRSLVLFCVAAIEAVLIKIRTAVKIILLSLLFMGKWLDKRLAPVSQYINVHLVRPVFTLGLALFMYVALMLKQFRAASEMFLNRERPQ